MDITILRTPFHVFFEGVKGCAFGRILKECCEKFAVSEVGFDTGFYIIIVNVYPRGQPVRYKNNLFLIHQCVVIDKNHSNGPPYNACNR